MRDVISSAAGVSVIDALALPFGGQSTARLAFALTAHLVDVCQDCFARHKCRCHSTGGPRYVLIRPDPRHRPGSGFLSSPVLSFSPRSSFASQTRCDLHDVRSRRRLSCALCWPGYGLPLSCDMFISIHAHSSAAAASALTVRSHLTVLLERSLGSSFAVSTSYPTQCETQCTSVEDALNVGRLLRRFILGELTSTHLLRPARTLTASVAAP